MWNGLKMCSISDRFPANARFVVLLKRLPSSASRQLLRIVVMSVDSGNLKVTFFPPLYHQRRIWILDILRREHVTEVVDVGCGEGALLSTLCQPAPWLGPRGSQGVDDDLSSLFGSVGLNDDDTPDLHTTRIAGLDISSREIEAAVEFTSPSSANALYTRWEPLDVDLWQGSVDVINPAFINAECIVATEIIEHLPDDVLVHFAPVILGVYQPRLFLVTTPSYNFNARFSPPGVVKPGGYPDPTGRTDRVFRHSDHKFEWTLEEFAQWCASVAKKWGYVVDTGSVGMAQEEDPWGRDSSLGGASQVAAFKRLDDRVSKEKRTRGSQEAQHATSTKEPHRLVKQHHYVAHPRAGNPSTHEEIGEAMVQNFEQWGETSLRVEELWFSQDVPFLCGGSIEIMLEAVERHKRLDLQRMAGQGRGNWKVELIGGVQRRLMHWAPVKNASVGGAETVTMEDEEMEHEMQDSSFDSGIDMGRSYDENHWQPEDTIRGQEDESSSNWGVGWGGGWTDETTSDWGSTVEATSC
ncbi:hypothetical protein HYDPIDRAFT_128429, partial [Hydnomerulius pinastri MD-312]